VTPVRSAVLLNPPRVDGSLEPPNRAGEIGMLARRPGDQIQLVVDGCARSRARGVGGGVEAEIVDRDDLLTSNVLSGRDLEPDDSSPTKVETERQRVDAGAVETSCRRVRRLGFRRIEASRVTNVQLGSVGFPVMAPG